MHILKMNISIFNFDVFYMFRTRGFIFRKTVVCAFKNTVSNTHFCLLDCLYWSMYNTPYHNCIYNHLPEYEPSDSKPVEDIKIKN
jgi:hypothetical protein